MEASGVSGRSYHEKIKAIGDSISGKKISFQSGNNKRMGWFPWLQSMIYDDGIIYLSFNTALKDFLLELEGGFTQYNYRVIGELRGGYAIRMFEILKQYAPIGKRRVKLVDLRRMLGIENKYPGYGNFKQRVLIQAKKELEKMGILTFEFEEIKKNRKVEELVFYIELHEKELKPEDMLNVPDNDGFVEGVQELFNRYQTTIKKETIQSWKDKYSLLLIEEALEETKEQKINFPDAFFNKVLENKRAVYLEQIKEIEAEKDEAKFKIMQYIRRHATDQPLPDWFAKKLFEDDLKKDYAKTEIEQLWNDNKDYILSRLKLKNVNNV